MSRAVRRPVALGVLTVGAAFVSCGPPLTEVWQLTDFRIVGMRADPPDVAYGATSQLTLETLDPMNRAVQVEWAACPFALAVDTTTGTITSGTGSLAGCQILAPTTMASVMVPTTGGARNQANQQVLTILGYACAGGTTQPPTGSDAGFQPTCVGTNATGWQFTGTLHVHDPSVTEVNHNPTISEVRFGPTGATTAIDDTHPGTAPACAVQTSRSTCPVVQFEVGFTADSRESYTTTNPTTGAVTTQNELLTVGYIVDGGTLGGGFRTDSNADTASMMSTMADTWRPPSTPGTTNVWIYAFDSRGGFDWAHRTVQTTP